MLEVTITTKEFDRQSGTWLLHPFAQLHADGRDVRVLSGDVEALGLRELRLRSPSGDVLACSDGEAWARLLPQAFGSCPLNVDVRVIDGVDRAGAAALA